MFIFSLTWLSPTLPFPSFIRYCATCSSTRSISPSYHPRRWAAPARCVGSLRSGITQFEESCQLLPRRLLFVGVPVRGRCRCLLGWLRGCRLAFETKRTRPRPLLFRGRQRKDRKLWWLPPPWSVIHVNSAREACSAMPVDAHAQWKSVFHVAEDFAWLVGLHL